MCKYIDELKKVNYTKNKIKDIAKKYQLTPSELKKYYQTKFFQNRVKLSDVDRYKENWNVIKEQALMEKK